MAKSNILSRFGDILKSNINDLLSKAEDPVKLANQYLIDAKNDLAEVKTQYAIVRASTNKAKLNYEKQLSEAIRFQKAAEAAVEDGDDDAALKLLERLQIEEGERDAAKAAWDESLAIDNQMAAVHKKLENDIISLEARVNQVKTNVAVAKAKETVNGAAKYGKGSGASDKLNRLLERTGDRLNEATAYEEINNMPTDEVDELASQYLSGASKANSRLAELKAKLGKA
jgi:phage shock protein A